MRNLNAEFGFKVGDRVFPKYTSIPYASRRIDLRVVNIDNEGYCAATPNNSFTIDCYPGSRGIHLNPYLIERKDFQYLMEV